MYVEITTVNFQKYPDTWGAQTYTGIREISQTYMAETLLVMRTGEQGKFHKTTLK